MRFEISPFCIAALLTSACAFSPSAATPKIEFSDLQQVKPAVTTKTEIERVFGRPSFTTAAQQEEGELWYYGGEGAFFRASFYFPKNTEKVDTVNWQVSDTDPERQLQTALKLYPKAKWQIKTVDWVNPHALPDECYFQDSELGISIEYDRSRKKVASIWRWNPSRKPANAQVKNPAKPPKFCIGETCTDGIPGNQWLKESNWKLCEVPK